MSSPISKMGFTAVCIWLLCLVNLYQVTGITIVTVPSTVIQGQSASITCTNATTVISIDRRINLIECFLSQPVCSISDDDEFNMYRNNHYITHNSTSLTVTITNVSRNRDGGLWECTSLSDPAKYIVDVKVPVAIVTIFNKTSLIFTDGQTTFITCKTGVSYPPASITWSIGGKNINGGTTTNNTDGTTTSILQYTPDKTDNNKILQCSATNGYGSTKSDSITLNIRYVTVVHIYPTTSPYKTIKGKQLHLTCVVDEANPLLDQSTGFTWSKDNVTIQGQRSSVYRVESVERSHTGSYRCTGDNGVGTGTSTPVQVDILFPPIVSTPSVYIVAELTDISLQCTATANPGDITYRWTGPGNLNTTGPWLNISNISKDRSGVYTCTATNLMKPTSSSSVTGRGQSTTEIDVLFGPTVTISPNTSSIKIQENTTLRLNCTVQSNPLPTSVKWYKPDGTSIDVSSDGQLVITSIKRNENGLYRCEANMTLEPSNGGSISRSDRKTVHITVQYLDEVTINRKRLEVSEDQEVNITCSTDSNPVASITWYNGTRSIRTIRSNTDSLIIDTATCLDTGVYTCQAFNSVLQLQSVFLFVTCSPRHDPRVDRISTVTGNIGDVVQLVADVLVYPAPSFTWYYINTTTGGVIPIFNDGSYQHNVINTSINTFRSTLNINITSNIFYRTYAVNITNDVGSTDLMFEVKDQFLVSSVSILKINSLILTDGQTTFITCKTGVSYPPASITWSIGGNNINGGTTTNNTDGTTTSILQYTPDKTDHNKILQCSATNGYGSTKSDSITLNIRYESTTEKNSTVQLSTPRNDVRCTKNSIKVFIPLKFAKANYYVLKDPRCGTYNNGTHLLIEFKFDECGTQLEFKEDSLVFSNQLKEISDSDEVISIQCEYPRLQNVSLRNNSYPPETKVVIFEKGRGVGFMSIQQYKDGYFVEPVTSSMDKQDAVKPGDLIYMKIAVEGAFSNVKVGVIASTCTVVPISQEGEKGILLVENNCVKNADVKIYKTEKQFFQFHFPAPAFKIAGKVHVRCQVAACNKRSDCYPNCPKKLDRKRRSIRSSSDSLFLTSEPIVVRETSEKYVKGGTIALAGLSILSVVLLVAVIILVKDRQNVNKRALFKEKEILQ